MFIFRHFLFILHYLAQIKQCYTFFKHLFVSFPRPPPSITFAAKKNDMATIFQTEFDSIYLTSLLPEEVEIESDQPSIEVAFYLNNLKVFASTYYPFNELVRVRDIRSILEAAMSLRNMTLANLKIVATEPVFNEPQVTLPRHWRTSRLCTAASGLPTIRKVS